MGMDANFWHSLIRQMMLEGMVRKDIEEYGLLKITDKGRKFLKKPYSIMVALNHNYEDQTDDEEEVSVGSGPASVDPALFEMLEDLRRQVRFEDSDDARKALLVRLADLQELSLHDVPSAIATHDGKALRLRKRWPTKAPVTALAVCPPDGFGPLAVAAVVGDEVWIVR